FLAAHEAEVEAHGRAPGERVADRGIGAPPDLLAVIAEALELEVAECRVEVEGPVDLTGAEISLEEAERTALDTALEEPCVVARLRDEIDRPAQRIAAVPESVGPLVDLDVLGGRELERFEIREPIGVPVGEAVDQHVDAAQVEVVAQ